MSHWRNFPASSSMTDFEIVVVQNERARWKRESMERHQESNDNNYNQEQDQEDALVTNILSQLDPAFMPVPLTPLHPTPSPIQLEDGTIHIKKVTLSEDDQAVIESNVHNYNIDNLDDSQQLDDQMQLNSESNDSSSSGSYQSVQSSNTPTKVIPITEEDQIIPITEEGQHIQVGKVPILFRGNDLTFMTDINKMNVKNKKRTILISAVRPSFHRPHNEFFICHVCHRRPRQIKIIEELWEMAEAKNKDDLGDEFPFAYNLKGIIDHLTNYHCLPHEDKSRDMVVAVANYIDMINKDIEEFLSPMFCFEDFKTFKILPKASSTSCLHVSWKTEQPELTMDLAHHYNFLKHTDYCRGHSKSSAPKCLEFELDLANTVYCSCNAPTIDLSKMDRPSYPVAKEIFDLELNIFQENTFFNKERKSIHQSHKAVLCKFKIPQPWPKFQKRTYEPSKPITRKDTKEKLLQDLATVKSYIRSTQNSQGEAAGAAGEYPTDCLNFIIKNWDVFSLQENSSKETPTKKELFSPEQQDLPKSSCSRELFNPEQQYLPKSSCLRPPPEGVRLRPEGNSPPLPPERKLPPLPPPPRLSQPPDEERAGNSVKAKVGHAVATAASLLKRPARKADRV